jgi:carbon-monoxide dehydrogenase medium subunit
LLNLREYHRPAARDEGLDVALALLARPGIHTVVLAGGDSLLASGDASVEAVVDLQGLGLDAITAGQDVNVLRIGAMVTRAALSAWGAGDPRRDEGASEARATSPLQGSSPLQRFLAACAHRWGGNVQRNRATVGGAVVTAAGNDPLVAALLACDTEVVLAEQHGERTLPLADFLRQRAVLLAAPAIVTELRVPAVVNDAGYACETVARTPSDAPVVLAVASVTQKDRRCARARLIIGGVAETPVRIGEAEALLEGATLTHEAVTAAAEQAAASINPVGDYRGSAEYRRAMVKVLARRALLAAYGDAARGAS